MLTQTTTSIFMFMLLSACNGMVHPQGTPITSPVPIRLSQAATPTFATGTPTIQQSMNASDKRTPVPVEWAVYDPDPQHLWNRLFRALWSRTTVDGAEYGRDALDPLLWEGITPPFLKEPAYGEALRVLDEFLATRGENLIANPLKHAMLQRDLWAVFDWLAVEAKGSPSQHQALELRLAQAVQRLALTKEQIERLPDNYQATVNAHVFPMSYQQARPSVAFLPNTLFTPRGDWISVGREGGPIAITHVQSFPFVGRSVFLLFVRVPAGREPTLNFFRALQDGAPNLELSDGTEVALVRQMLLIDTQGNLVASPIVESIQIRHFYADRDQSFYEFILNRNRLFGGETGGLEALTPDATDFALFNAHGVDFSILNSQQADQEQVMTLMTCQACHVDQFQRIMGLQSVLSYSRRRFPLPDQQKLILTETTPLAEIQATVRWKLQHGTWQTLQALWQK